MKKTLAQIGKECNYMPEYVAEQLVKGNVVFIDRTPRTNNGMSATYEIQMLEIQDNRVVTHHNVSHVLGSCTGSCVTRGGVDMVRVYGAGFDRVFHIVERFLQEVNRLYDRSYSYENTERIHVL